MAARRLRLFLKLFTDDVIAKLYAFIADEYAWPRDQLAHLVLALATKRAVEDFAAVAGSALAFFGHATRSEEHTSELQSLMRISYAVFCLKKKNIKQKNP